MSDAPVRKKVTQTTTTVLHVLRAFGPIRTNPPSLGQLREFVMACDDLPNDTPVQIEKSSLDEGGRYNYRFSIRIVEDHRGETNG
jgi:hypothetical protein